MRTRLIICASAALILLSAPLESAAQDLELPAQNASQPATFESTVTLADIQRQTALDLTRVGSFVPLPQSGAVAAPAPKKRSATRVILGAAVGATAGLFAGGYIGQAIEGDSCHCDDPGLMGALIGAPIGAVVGGILGGFFLF